MISDKNHFPPPTIWWLFLECPFFFLILYSLIIGFSHDSTEVQYANSFIWINEASMLEALAQLVHFSLVRFGQSVTFKWSLIYIRLLCMKWARGKRDYEKYLVASFSPELRIDFRISHRWGKSPGLPLVPSFSQQLSMYIVLVENSSVG